MRTQDLRVVTYEGAVAGNFYADARFYYKEGGVEYRVDKVHTNMKGTPYAISITNQNNGEAKIVTVDELAEGRYRNTFYFEKR